MATPQLKIVYVSGTRADYGLMRPALKALQTEPKVDLKILVTGMHLRQEFGHTLDEIEKDGFEIFAKLDTLQRQSSSLQQTIALGETITAMAKALDGTSIDTLLLLGDRDEQLAAALCASHLNLGMTHVHAGERSGSIDDANRHAISRYAHLLLTATDDSTNRLIKSGEEAYRVHTVGAPAIDAFHSYALLSREQLSKELGVDLQKPFVLLLQHSVTYQESEAAAQIRASLSAIEESRLTCIAFKPNADAGATDIANQLQSYADEGKIHLLTHTPHKAYASLLSHAKLLVGNSSSGLIEAPYFCLPVINVGERQSQRFRGKNVIDVPHKKEAILSAIRSILNKPNLRDELADQKHLYGDGHAAEKICDALLNFDWRDREKLKKRIVY